MVIFHGLTQINLTIVQFPIHTTFNGRAREFAVASCKNRKINKEPRQLEFYSVDLITQTTAASGVKRFDIKSVEIVGDPTEEVWSSCDNLEYL